MAKAMQTTFTIVNEENKFPRYGEKSKPFGNPEKRPDQETENAVPRQSRIKNLTEPVKPFGERKAFTSIQNTLKPKTINVKVVETSKKSTVSTTEDLEKNQDYPPIEIMPPNDTKYENDDNYIPSFVDDDDRFVISQLDRLFIPRPKPEFGSIDLQDQSDKHVEAGDFHEISSPLPVVWNDSDDSYSDLYDIELISPPPSPHFD